MQLNYIYTYIYIHIDVHCIYYIYICMYVCVYCIQYNCRKFKFSIGMGKLTIIVYCCTSTSPRMSYSSRFTGSLKTNDKENTETFK